MSSCLVWIDSVHAKVFDISPSGIKRKVVKLNAIQHSNNHYEANRLNSEENFFHDVATTLGKDAERFLIMGPGVAKGNFKKHLERHHHPLIPKLVGIETLADVSDNKILEASRNHFKKYNAYHFVNTP